MFRAFLAVLVSIAVASAARAGEAPDEGIAAMDAIAFLAGEWQGEGWMQRGPEGRHTFTSTETVNRRLDGRLLVIEGLHRAETGEVVHHALAVVSHEAETGGYRFRSYLADGKADEHAAELVDGAFVWGFETDRGRVRFTIRVEENEWHEVGHFSPDGEESWHPFFQMDLTRVGP